MTPWANEFFEKTGGSRPLEWTVQVTLQTGLPDKPG